MWGGVSGSASVLCKISGQAKSCNSPKLEELSLGVGEKQ